MHAEYIGILLIYVVSFCEAKICLSDSSCPPGMQCTPATSGYSICMKAGQIIERNYPTPPPFYCNSDQDCARTQVCVRRHGKIGSCLDSKSGGAGLPCSRNADCSSNLRCVDYHGRWLCLEMYDMIECSSTIACQNGKDCVYSESEKKHICIDAVKVPQPNASLLVEEDEANSVEFNNDNEEVVLEEDYRPITMLPAVSWNIRENGSNTYSSSSLQQSVNGTNSTKEAAVMETKYLEIRGPQSVPKQALIDPAALPCEVDYQCRMGESCSGKIALVDRMISVCQYDVTKTDRQCIYHADCLQGQQCLRKGSNVFVCTASMEAALGTSPCTYDYECSGGEKCVNLVQEGEKVFRCRPSQVKDPRRDQLCRSNAECPYQQVCRRIAAVSLCVDVMPPSASPPAMLNVQRKIVTFIQNLLFSRL